MRIVISSGHGQHISGAVGILNERAENVRVTDRVAVILRANGHQATVFHDTNSRTVSNNIGAINAFHRQQTRDLDVSVHFNAHSKTTAPRGTEVLYRNTPMHAVARRVSRAIATAGGFIDRGAKHRTNLGFLNSNTNAVLLEVCFVDSEADARLYRANFEAICQAIASSLVGDAVSPSTPAPSTPVPSTTPETIREGSRGPAVVQAQQLLGGLNADGIFGPITATRTRAFQSANGLNPDAIIGPITWAALLAQGAR